MGKIPEVYLARFAFVLILAFSLFSLICYGLRQESYPALTMPPFPGHPLENGVVRAQMQPSFVVDFADGSRQTLPHENVTPTRENGLPAVFPDALRDSNRATDRRTVDWLQTRLEEIYPSSEVKGVTIEFANVSYEASSGRYSRELAKEITIDFSSVR